MTKPTLFWQKLAITSQGGVFYVNTCQRGVDIKRHTQDYLHYPLLLIRIMLHLEFSPVDTYMTKFSCPVSYQAVLWDK